jgi:aromatic ring-opening dioxygenase LigB subunit
MDLEFVERAKPDSLWQMLILYGALELTPMKGELISYQVPSYFGMLVASFEPVNK